MLTLHEIRLIGKAMHILRILADARNKPQMFPDKDSRVIYSDHFKSKALSKEEILAWQNANDGGLDETRLTGEEFDAMIGLSGLVATINHYHEGTENVKATYYCLSVGLSESDNSESEKLIRTIVFNGTTLDPESTRVICKQIFIIQLLIKIREKKGIENPDIITPEDYAKEIYITNIDELTSLFELLHSNGVLIKSTKGNEISYALTPIPDPIERVGPVKPIL